MKRTSRRAFLKTVLSGGAAGVAATTIPATTGLLAMLIELVRRAAGTLRRERIHGINSPKWHLYHVPANQDYVRVSDLAILSPDGTVVMREPFDKVTLIRGDFLEVYYKVKLV